MVTSAGKKRMTDCMGSDGIVELAKNFPNENAIKFLDWFLYSELKKSLIAVKR